LNLSNTIAFIDEFGTNSLDFEKKDISSHFIITCILIKKDKIEDVMTEIEMVRRNNFQTGEMKSNGVGENHKRRMKILAELVKSDFRIFALIVDKRKLMGEGFGYKPSFYKFLFGLIYKDLYKVFAQVDVHMDEHGGEQFMKGFIKYIRKNHPPDLFTPENKISFEKSEENILIQLADFICGSLARIFDETKKTDFSNNILSVIRKKIEVLNFFPANYDRFTYDYNGDEKRINPEIDELSMRRANAFILNNENNTDPTILIQVKTLKLLRLHRQTINCFRYISTNEILEHLNFNSSEKVSEYFFRTNIIAKLRDKDVLIASSKNGYKLPVSKADLYDFINHGSTVILPMVNRIRKCVDLIKLSTGVDLIEEDKYGELKKIIDSKYD
jgi:hypothetical protein